MSVFTYISLFSFVLISSYIILGIYCRYLNVYICFVLFLFVAYYSNSRTESNFQMIHTTYYIQEIIHFTTLLFQFY